jgi:hypothetical protein
MKNRNFFGFAVESRTLQTLAIITTAVLLAGCHKSDAASETPKTDVVLSDTNTAPSTAAQPSAPDQQQAAAAPAQSTTPSTTDDAAQQASIDSNSQFQWPRTYKDSTTTLLVYQPKSNSGMVLILKRALPFPFRTRLKPPRPLA